MIAAAHDLLLSAVLSMSGSYGTYLPGDTKDSLLLFHFTPDDDVAVAELDASKTVARSETRLFHAAEHANLVRAARGPGGIYVVVGSQSNGDVPVVFFRMAAHGPSTPPMEIGHGSMPSVASRADSKYVVVSFFEEREPNEPMRGSTVGPPRHAMHVQVRDASTLDLAGARMFRGRDDKLVDDSVLMAPGVVMKNTQMVSADRVAIDLPARPKRRSIVVRLPLLQVIADRDGPMMGDRESDDDDSVVRIDEEPDDRDQR